MSIPHTGPRIATLDIETAPITAYVWGLFKQNVGLNQIITDWSILSFSYKWLHSKKVHYSDVSGQEDLRDDSNLLDELWQVLDDADIIVAQNGRQFDVKKINARFLEAGFEPPSPYRIVDTLEMAKQIAKFTSNKQDWLSQLLTDQPKEHHNEFPGMTLWTECLAGNMRAWAVMKKYNKRDITGCESMYLAMRPFYQGHPNVAAYYADDARRCPKCGTADMIEQEKPALTDVGRYTQYKCGGCGGFSRSRYTQNSIEKRQALLTN
jgi:RNase_H superfamily